MQNFQLYIPKSVDSEGKSSDILIIPSLIRHSKPNEVSKLFESVPNKEILYRKYIFPFIPQGVFENLFCKIAGHLGNDIKFWDHGIYLDLKDSHLLLELKLQRILD